MSNLNLISIGTLFDLEKGSLQSSKCTEGEYTFITASQEWKTHNNYSHECEALIFAAASTLVCWEVTKRLSKPDHSGCLVVEFKR
jgi:type I restriction enzyme S subunit